ncbi:AraC family transcriptional regulator [Rhodoflexus sp.]
MKPDFENIPYEPGNSFLLRTICRQSRTSMKGAWHFHPEIEICYTLKSKGKRFVGVDIDNYEEGDLVLLGSELPHCWITDEETEQIVIQFKDDFLGKDFFSASEFKEVNRLLQEAAGGLQFSKETSLVVGERIVRMLTQNSFQRLLSLFEILHLLAQAPKVTVLSQNIGAKRSYTHVSKKIQKIYAFILEHMTGDLTLEATAEHIGMTKTTLCYFLKNNTGKSFSNIVNDMRVAHAARLLQDTDMNVQEVCYQSGYNDPSYFYRVFQARIGVSPRKYKLRFQTEQKNII